MSARPSDEVLAFRLVERQAHGPDAERRRVLLEEAQDRLFVRRGLQRHGERAEQVGLPRVVEAAARVATIGTLAEGDPREVQ